MKDIDFARICFENRQFDKAKEIFLNNNMLYEAGFSALLTGNIQSAGLIWKEVKDPCPGTDWGLIILDLLEKRPLVRTPKYFQTRAFLELYLNLFIENELYDWADEIINAYKFFGRANSETPKFLARVLYSFGYFKMAREFSGLSKRICYADPEIHYIEAEIALVDGDLAGAKKSVYEILKFAPEYYPAKRLKKILENQEG